MRDGAQFQVQSNPQNSASGRNLLSKRLHRSSEQLMFLKFIYTEAMALLLCILGLAAFPSFGIRMEHDSPSQSAWNSTSSEELQQMLMEELSPGGPGRTASALECTRDENDESLETPLGVREGWVSQDAESLEKLIGRVRNAWAEGDASGCFQQLGSMIANLTTTCEENKPQENYMDYIFQYYTPPLSKKTCKDSVDDIFVHGSALVEAMQISKEDVAALKLDATTVAMVQSLFFLRAWLIPLARTHSSALLWAGFWDADPSKRTTLETLGPRVPGAQEYVITAQNLYNWCNRLLCHILEGPGSTLFYFDFGASL